MVDEAETYIMSAKRKSSLIEGMFRRDITEYSRESLRESIANAVPHRDYSPYVRGSYIQIRMFADRLEVQSPGELFGNVTVIPQSYPDDSTGHILAESIFAPSAQRSSTVGPGIPATAFIYRQSGLSPLESSRRDDRRSGSARLGTVPSYRTIRFWPMDKICP
jgi:ATP-dependent DNA helicase RecG